uniref:Uncharacterized protein n=1 Tax=Arundo donax TaxID=35708 RepID=A0A0A9ATX9_ARUDO
MWCHFSQLLSCKNNLCS